MVNRTVPRQDAQANRERLLAAARDLFREKGIHVEVREIAERAELAVGTIYRNFPSKDGLIIAILREGISAATADAAAGEAGNDPMAGLRALLRRHLALVERYGWLFDAYLNGQLPESCRAELQSSSQEYAFRARLRRLLDRAVANGSLRPGLSTQVAAAMLAGAVASWSSTELLTTRTPEQLVDEILESLLSSWRPAAQNESVEC
jgi:AcrR family transcriptional regulator